MISSFMARRATRNTISSDFAGYAGTLPAVAARAARDEAQSSSSRRFLGERASARASYLEKGEASSIVPLSETVVKAMAGDREAFRTLVEEHYAAIFGLCRRLLCGREHEAEEAAQDTFLNAYKYLPTLADPGRFSNWLCQIARSFCRDRRRRWRVEERALSERREALLRQFRGGWTRASSYEAERFPAAEEPEAEGLLQGGSPVGAALNDLPEEERNVLLLRYFCGL